MGKKVWKKKMSWADKALKKHRVEKMTEKVLNDSRFRKQQEEQLNEVLNEALNRFLIISVDYMIRHLGFGRKRVMKFLGFVVEQMEYAKENDDYFISMNESIRDENGIDVLRNKIVEKGGKTDAV